MYKAVRKRDGLTMIREKYANIEYSPVGNIIHKWPPKKGCGALIYNSISDGWQTTLITEVEKINDDSYIFKTENSEYKIEIIEGNEITISVANYHFNKK